MKKDMKLWMVGLFVLFIVAVIGIVYSNNGMFTEGFQAPAGVDMCPIYLSQIQVFSDDLKQNTSGVSKTKSLKIGITQLCSSFSKAKCTQDVSTYCNGVTLF